MAFEIEYEDNLKVEEGAKVVVVDTTGEEWKGEYIKSVRWCQEDVHVVKSETGVVTWLFPHSKVVCMVIHKEEELANA